MSLDTLTPKRDSEDQQATTLDLLHDIKDELVKLNAQLALITDEPEPPMENHYD